MHKLKSTYEVHVKMAANRELRQRIRVRSARISKKLHDKIDTVIGSSTTPVQVIAITNQDYGMHVSGYTPKKTPVHNVEQTNVPTLQEWALATPNEARLNEARHMQDVILPALFSRLRLSVSRTPIERKAELEAHVTEPLGMCRGLITTICTQSAKEFLAIMVPHSSSFNQSWSAKAEHLCTGWEDRFNTGQFLQLMRRCGRRQPRGKACSVDMNAELINIGAQGISHNINRTAQALNKLRSSLRTEMEGMFATMGSRLQDSAATSHLDLTDFFKHLSNAAPKLEHIVKAFDQRLEAGIENIRRKATAAHEDAYVVVAMLSVYKRISELIGKSAPQGGWAPARKAALKATMRDVTGPWAATIKGMTADLKELFSGEIKRFADEIEEFFEDCLQSFNEMCGSNEIDDPDVVAFQQELAEALVEVEARCSGPMQQSYDSISAEFR